MGNRYVVIIFILCIVIIKSTNAANIEDVKFVQDETVGILGDGIAKIIEVSPPEEREIIRKIKIRVPIDPAPVNVKAYREQAVNYIEISTGFSAILRMIDAGFILEEFYPTLDKNSGMLFAEYLANSYATGALGGGLAPWDFRKFPKAKVDEIYGNQKFNARVQVMHVAALWFVLAHEVAHHVLNHKFDKDLPLDKVRSQEDEADTWAASALIKMGIPPSAATTASLYWYFLDTKGVKNESLRTHPPELRRIKKILELTLSQSDTWGRNSPMTTKEMEVFQRKITLLLVDVDKRIAAEIKLSPELEKGQGFKMCMGLMQRKCIKSCMEQFGNSKESCESKFCIKDSGGIWKMRCYELHDKGVF